MRQLDDTFQYIVNATAIEDLGTFFVTFLVLFHCSAFWIASYEGNKLKGIRISHRFCCFVDFHFLHCVCFWITRKRIGLNIILNN